MKGDFSRLTFHPTKHYTSVRMQQGRVLPDADWSEQAEILADSERMRFQTLSVIGESLRPVGFAIQASHQNAPRGRLDDRCGQMREMSCPDVAAVLSRDDARCRAGRLFRARRPSLSRRDPEDVPFVVELRDRGPGVTVRQ